MTHSYTITGLTCSGCASKVQVLLAGINGVEKVTIDLEKKQAAVTMHHHIQTEQLQYALKDYPKYQLSEQHVHKAADMNETEPKTWFETYKPILLIFAYILAISLLSGAGKGTTLTHWMNNFMGGFFITFSFFKFLDLKGFAESYSSYDIIAKHWLNYGYIYAFIELALGIAYITSFHPVITNAVTLVVMSVSIIGVLQSVFAKRKIKCACLGAVFNLPMSTVTITEDSLMIVMSLLMLVSLVA